jgi:hypothetical protein
VKKFALLGEAR